MKSRPTVRLAPPSDRGRLWPRYDEEARLLTVGSDVPRDWPYGADISGRVIFDIDRDGLVANFDVIIPKERWRVTQLILPALATESADLGFTREALKHKSFSVPVAVTTNHERSVAIIRFGDEAAPSRAVRLSDRCFALVDGDELAGFVVGVMQDARLTDI